MTAPLGAVSALLLALPGDVTAAGSEFNLSCRPDEVLVGVSGRQAWWMVGIAARCRSVVPNGALGNTVRTTPLVGGTTAEQRTFDCAPTEVMVGYRGTQGDNGYVLHVHQIVCADWQPQSRTAGAAIRAVAAFEAKPGAGRSATDACRDGQVGTRLRGRAGQYLDRLIDMGCSYLAGATPPAQTTDGTEGGYQ